ncbi:MAG TPA: hypothetical protein ENO09_02570 [bacterium]|jgi:hypothetical protein|nr:hypothetical protein [bacterium]
MSAKKINIGTRPTARTQEQPGQADDWVKDRASEPMKRLTIDIPAELHRAIKTATASRGAKIADEVRELLLQKYGNH